MRKWLSAVGSWGKWLSAVGSRLSGKQELERPTADTRHPTPQSNDLPTHDTRQPTAREPNWALLYGTVIAELAILIIIFYAFTKAFA